MSFSRNAFYSGLIIVSLITGNAVASDKFLRVSLDLMEGTTFKDVDCSSNNPRARAFYGCPYRSVGDFSAVPAFEFGFGYANGSARYEILVDYRPGFKFEGRTNYGASREDVSAKLSSISGMLAGFVDFKDGVIFGSALPFIGLGIGIVHNRIGNTTINFPKTTVNVPGGNHTDLAWMATAGISTALTERVTLEFAWRYTDLGEVRTAWGVGSTTYLEDLGDFKKGDVDSYNIRPTRAKLAGHGVRMSLRYSF